jgi:hypothetical protein
MSALLLCPKAIKVWFAAVSTRSLWKWKPEAAELQGGKDTAQRKHIGDMLSSFNNSWRWMSNMIESDL